jgi:hypothetical protein
MLQKRFQLSLFFILLAFVNSKAQDFVAERKERNFGVSLALESGITLCFQDRIQSNGFIKKGNPYADPQVGFFLKTRWKKFRAEAGITLHSYSVTYGYSDPAILASGSSSVMTDHSGYRKYQLRIGYQVTTRKKWFSLEPYAGYVLLSMKKEGFFSGGSSNGSMFSASDSVYINQDWRAYNLGRNFMVPMVGLKTIFTFRKSSFYLSSEYIWSQQDWRSTEVRYFRNSMAQGLITDQGIIYSKIKNLSLNIGYSFRFY